MVIGALAFCWQWVSLDRDRDGDGDGVGARSWLREVSGLRQNRLFVDGETTGAANGLEWTLLC